MPHANAPTKVGVNLIALMRQHGLTRRDVALAANLDEATLYRVERGLTAPTLDTVNRLAVALEVDVATLLS
jgi:transcriptional regulator with XRE-family HTH domain